MRIHLLTILSLVLATAPIGSHSNPPRNVEKGHDVGDGITPLNSPYDPKNVAEITFVTPTVEYPFYEIVVPMGDWTEGKNASVTGVKINGRECESYNVFVDGFAHVNSGWITNRKDTAPNVVLAARAPWHNGESVMVQIEVGSVTKEYEATAPGQGGAPLGWRRYQSFVAREKAGLDRENEPVEISITVRAENCGDLETELRLFQLDSESGEWSPCPFQTFNAKEYPGTPPGSDIDNYLQHPSKSVEVVFPASVSANGSEVYCVFYDNPEAEALDPPETDLMVSGPSLGATVENWFFTTSLSAKNGQIASFDLKPENWADAIPLGSDKQEVTKGKRTESSWKGREVPRLTNSYSYAVHWNPDSFSDNGLWGHTFSWDPPEETIVAARGPLMFRIANTGRMPGYTPQVWTSVTYTFYAGVPYALATTMMEVRDPLNASAIRNGEIVMDSHLMTHFVWEEKTGGLETVPTVHGPTWQDEWVYRVDHDVPWIAMTNELDHYGVGTAITESFAYNPKSGRPTIHRPAFYLYYHHFWHLPLTYFTRAWVYPFSDYQRGPILQVDPGSTYIDRMAFLPFPLYEGEDRYEEIQEVSKKLLNPLEIRWGR
jgi:hypothetical protein